VLYLVLLWRLYRLYGVAMGILWDIWWFPWRLGCLVVLWGFCSIRVFAISVETEMFSALEIAGTVGDSEGCLVSLWGI
jgi:hypothetical protein